MNHEKKGIVKLEEVHKRYKTGDTTIEALNDISLGKNIFRTYCP